MNGGFSDVSEHDTHNDTLAPHICSHPVCLRDTFADPDSHTQRVRACMYVLSQRKLYEEEDAVRAVTHTYSICVNMHVLLYSLMNATDK